MLTKRGLGVFLALALPLVLVPGVATADADTDGQGDVIIGTGTGGGDGTPGDDGGGGSGGTSRCAYQGSEVPCHASGGASNWSSSLGCYLSLAAAQPADPPSTTGALYECRGFNGVGSLVWIEGAPPTGPDPGVLAQQVVDRIVTHPVEIGIVPEQGANRMGLIGMPTWMWVADPGPHTLGPIGDSASVGTTSITATGSVTSITWNMGDGTSVTCHGAGTPYTDSAGDSDSPDCGHRYHSTSKGQPDDKFHVTATAHWQFDWHENGGGGQSGTITFDQESNAAVRVGELQVLVRRG